MAKKIVLTGIKPTGKLHIGNYIGAIKPSVAFANQAEHQCIYFVANDHALTALENPTLLHEYTYDVAATWLAFGLDPEKVIFYRQSDVPEVFELLWLLSCSTPKGLMNRAHAYKAACARNAVDGNEDMDAGINMGLFTYPILMAADILLFQTDFVPVGEDQTQHIEIARDIAGRWNHTYKPLFRLPVPIINKHAAIIPGLDGRKMSKSYNNTIPLFAESSKLKKLVYQIKTDSSGKDEPKDPEQSTLFQIYRELASAEDSQTFARRFQEGIGWAEAKETLYQAIERTLEAPRKRYQELIQNPQAIETLFAKGAERARSLAGPFLLSLRKALGSRC